MGHGTKKHGHWDQAVTNSSCLRAAVLRALKLEVGAFVGLDTVPILWDISSFVDSIRTVDVIAVGLQKEFTAIILRLALLVHCGLRAFKEKSFVGLGCRPLASASLLGVRLQSPLRGASSTTYWTTCTDATGQCR